MAMDESYRYAKICADYLSEECTRNAAYLDTTHYTRFHSSGIPNITLQDYFRRIAKYSHCSGECFVIALRYIQRYCDAAQSALTLRNAHRLIVVATMIAAKLRDDVFYDNKYYSNIGGINGREMNELELDMLVTMGWNTWVEKPEFDALFESARRVSHEREEAAGGQQHQPQQQAGAVANNGSAGSQQYYNQQQQQFQQTTQRPSQQEYYQ
jgi:hypothetical protein